jgi:thioredoxin 1
MKCAKSNKHWQLFVASGAVISAVIIMASGCSRSQADFSKEDLPSASASVESRIEHVNESDFEKKVLKSEVPVLVDFYADWCPPCRALAPVLEELAGELTDAKIVKVNVDENNRLASRFGITTIPRLIVFKNGEMINRHEGLADKATIKKILNTHF